MPKPNKPGNAGDERSLSRKVRLTMQIIRAVLFKRDHPPNQMRGSAKGICVGVGSRRGCGGRGEGVKREEKGKK